MDTKNKKDQGLSLEVQHTKQKPSLNHGQLLKQTVFCQISKTSTNHVQRI